MIVFSRQQFEEGIKTIPVYLHFHNGNGNNITMNNGSFFRVPPGTFASGSFSGYNACFPFPVPFNCRLKTLVLTCTNANYDFNASSGLISFDLHFLKILHNGSAAFSVYRIQWGNFSGSQIGFGFNTYNLDSTNYTLTAGSDLLLSGDLIGFRFVKSTVGVRDINSFQNILLTLNFEEDSP